VSPPVRVIVISFEVDPASSPGLLYPATVGTTDEFVNPDGAVAEPPSVHNPETNTIRTNQG
jgi:hypothetical protein